MYYYGIYKSILEFNCTSDDALIILKTNICNIQLSILIKNTIFDTDSCFTWENNLPFYSGVARGGHLPPGAARRGAPKSCQRIFKNLYIEKF